jgi:uncharacterized membrane protein
MDLRLALYELAARHKLDAQATASLRQLSGLQSEPARLSYWLPRGVAVLAAGLGGLGVIFWIAANWETFGRYGRFALLQGLFLVMCLGALWRPGARAPLGLLALLATGGLFAYFGQTYQTGADPWQLFAIWAALSLPLCLGARSDVLWMPWSLVAMTGISLWVHARIGHRWQIESTDFPVLATGWSAAVVLSLALNPILSRFTGAGPWSLRATIVLTSCLIMMTALGGLLDYAIAPHYWLALAMLIVSAGLLSLPRLYDIFGLSAISLALNILLVGGLVRLLFKGQGLDIYVALLALGLSAAGLLAATVSLILRLSRRRTNQGAGA